MKHTYRNDWVVDFDAMTCRNAANGAVVKIEFVGNCPYGVLDDLPDALLDTWLDDPLCQWHIVNTVTDAENAFWLKYVEKSNFTFMQTV